MFKSARYKSVSNNEVVENSKQMIIPKSREYIELQINLISDEINNNVFLGLFIMIPSFCIPNLYKNKLVIFFKS